MDRGQSPHAVFLGDVDQAQVGEKRHAEASDLLEALGIGERRREHRARLGEEALHFLGAAPRSISTSAARNSRAMSSTMPACAAMSASSDFFRRREALGLGMRDHHRAHHLPGTGPHRHHDATSQRRIARRQHQVERGNAFRLEGEIVESDRSLARERCGEQRLVGGRLAPIESSRPRPDRARTTSAPSVGVESEERRHRSAGQLAGGSGDGLQHALGVELGDERFADVTQDVRYGDDAPELDLRELRRVDVVGQADDSGDVARVVEERRVDRVHVDGGAVGAFDAKVSFQFRPSKTSRAISG